ncbi:hypothetical protein ACS0TY_017372 [Phlomoides rotata]
MGFLGSVILSFAFSMFQQRKKIFKSCFVDTVFILCVTLILFSAHSFHFLIYPCFLIVSNVHIAEFF